MLKNLMVKSCGFFVFLKERKSQCPIFSEEINFSKKWFLLANKRKTTMYFLKTTLKALTHRSIDLDNENLLG